MKNHPHIEIYPVVGNHDTWPVNTEDFRRPDTDFNINDLKEIWKGDTWLSDKESEVFG